MFTMQTKIAVISNKKNESLELISLLQNEGYEGLFFSEGNSLNVDLVNKSFPDIILVDLELKNTDGIELCYFLRKEKKFLPYIIVFSDKKEDYIEIEAFKAGADDYIIKPINPRVFTRKLKAFVNRSKQYRSDSYNQNLLTFKGVVVDLESHTIFKENKEIHLPRKDFEILQLFISNPDKIYSREAIHKLIWSSNEDFNPRIIDVHIRKIREKVGNYFIETIKGVGYRLAA